MINVVVVGFGFMGAIHSGNILKNSAACLSAIVDKDKASVQKRLEVSSGNFIAESIDAEHLSNVRLYDDFSTCLKTEKPDACVIAVHTHLHYEMAKMALDAGVHVFLEKPFCLDVSQGQELIELARTRNRLLMIGHVVRFMPPWHTLKNLMDSGKYGNLEFLSLSRFSGIPSWGQWKERQKEPGSSGGALFDLVIHDIDFALWACGVPESIEAQFLPGKLSNYDYVSTLWKYGDANLHVKIEGGNNYHSHYPFQASFSARFQHASLFYSTNDPAAILAATEGEAVSIPVSDPNEGFSDEINYFLNCILSDKQPARCTPESALETIKVCYRHTGQIN